jgi:hypothetical protein
VSVPPGQFPNGSERRFSELERRVGHIERDGTRHDAILERDVRHIVDDVADIRRDIGEVRSEVKGLRRVLITLVVTIAGSAVIFAITILAGRVGG